MDKIQSDFDFLYLSGKNIYGDSFDSVQIESWFREENSAYKDLGYIAHDAESYPYHYINFQYGFKFTSDCFQRVLGLGSASGSEFKPFKSIINNLVIIEPDTRYWRNQICGIPSNYIQPNVNGSIDYPDRSFDLITVFGVLHHIPNVSYVFNELVRLLDHNGYLVIREPIISMGDWRKPRNGLTKNERGISIESMRGLINASDCDIVKESFITFSPLNKFAPFFRKILGDGLFYNLDFLLCRMFQWNYKYHRKAIVDRFSPSNGFWVIRRK